MRKGMEKETGKSAELNNQSGRTQGSPSRKKLGRTRRQREERETARQREHGVNKRERETKAAEMISRTVE